MPHLRTASMLHFPFRGFVVSLGLLAAPVLSFQCLDFNTTRDCPWNTEPPPPSDKTRNSKLCAPGWRYYPDINASEGHASCYMEVDGCDGCKQGSVSWTRAVEVCRELMPDSHLLTVKSSDRPTPGGYGLLSHVLDSLTVRPYGYMGCYQSPFEERSALEGWGWIDGTNADNLNLNTAFSSLARATVWANTAVGQFPGCVDVFQASVPGADLISLTLSLSFTL